MEVVGASSNLFTFEFLNRIYKEWSGICEVCIDLRAG